MKNYHNNFYFKMLIKTFKIHKRLNDKELSESSRKFGECEYGFFLLPHLVISIMPFRHMNDLSETYCDLIVNQYAKDIASYHIRKIKEGNSLRSGNINFTLKQFERLLNEEEVMMCSFTKAIKDCQLKSWIQRVMGCSDCYLSDYEFYDLVYGNKR